MKKFFSLFLMTFVSVMMFAATETTVYYTAPAATIGTYSVKLNVNFKGDGDDWHQFDMTKTALTYNGDPVYSYKYTDAYDGVGVMQFQLYDGETWKSQKVAISSWTGVATYNGKMYVHATEQWVAAPADGGESGSEGAYKLTFVYYNKTDGDSSGKLSTVEGVFDEESQAYVDEVTKGSDVYAGRKYKDDITGDSIFSNLKFGSSSKAGQLTFTLKEEVEVDSIVFHAAMYSDTEGGDGFSVNGTAFTLSRGKLKFEEKVWKPTGKVSSIDIVQTKASKGRFFLTAISVYPKQSTGGDDPVVEEPAVIKLHGNFSDGSNWANTDAFTLSEDKKTATLKLTLNKGNYEFGMRIGADDNWTSNGVAFTRENKSAVVAAGEGNLKLAADTKGDYTFTWTYATNTLAIDFPEYVETLPEMQIAGAWNVENDAWVKNAMTPAEDKKTASYEVELKAGDYEFKVIKDGAWLAKANEGNAYGLHRDWTGVAGVVDQNTLENLKLTADVDGKYTFVWTFANDSIGIAFPDAPIEPTAKFYITGSANLVGEENAWQPNALPVMEDSKVLALEAGDYMLKLTMNGTWEGENNVKGYDALTGEIPAGVTRGTGNNDDNICFTLKEAGNVVVTYKVEEEVVTFTVTGNFYVRVPEYKDLYLVPGVWAEADAKIAAWIWGKELDGQWTAFFAGEGDTLTAKVNADADSIIFVRFNSAVETPAWSDEEGVIWNKANDQLINECNLFVINDWNLYSWCQANPFETWFGDADWHTETESNLVYDEAAKTATITIAQNKNGQWQAQVKYHGAPAKAGKYYDLSFKLKANKAFGGITVKYQDNAEMLYETTVALEENVELAYAKKDLEGLAGNGILVLDFGYAAEGTVITLSDVAIVEKDEPDEVVLPVMQIAGAWEVDAEHENAWVLNAMTPAENKKTASYEVELKAGDYEFKLIKDGAWLAKANEGNAYGLHRDWTGVAGVVDQNTSENLKLTADVDGKYTFVWTFANDSIGVVFPALPVKYCEFPTGHLNQADFGDPNARILLTIQKIADSNNLRVAVKNNNANGNTKTGLNYLWVNATGAKNNNATYGSHDAEDVEEVSVIVEFDEAQESYVFNNIHWAYAGWGGEWALDGLTVLASELCEAPETPAKFYITGDEALLGEKAWAPDAIKVTEDSYTFENLAAGDYKLKVTLDGTWNDGMAKGFDALTIKADGLTADKDNNICFTLAEAGNVTVTYTAETFTVTGNFYVAPAVEDGFYLVGKIGGVDQWAVSDLTAEKKFAANEGAEGEYVLSTTLAEGDAIKVVKVENNAIAAWYNDGGDNFAITAELAGKVVIYFRPEGNSDWGYFYFTVIKDTPDGIGNTADDAKAVKVLRNGQLLILKGGKTYNVMGTLVR